MRSVGTSYYIVCRSANTFASVNDSDTFWHLSITMHQGFIDGHGAVQVGLQELQAAQQPLALRH